MCTGVRLCQSKPHSCKRTYDTFRLYERRYDTERQEGIVMTDEPDYWLALAVWAVGLLWLISWRG